MKRQTFRAILMALSLGVCIAAVAMDNALVAALTGATGGMWFSAFMRRLADQRGIIVEDET